MEYLEYIVIPDIPRGSIQMSWSFNSPSNPAYVQQEQQNQRHEIARMQQMIAELEHHIATVHDRLAYLGRILRTDEQRQEYTRLLVQVNTALPQLQNYRESLAAMVRMTPMNYGRGSIPEQCRREIYHLYHAGRYTQEQLANQYGCGQSAISKIVNGPPPGQIAGVNPQGIAGS